MTRRAVPEVFYNEVKCDLPWIYNSPCVGGLVFDSLRVQEDVQTYGYDQVGNLTAAHNRYARVKRSYAPGGAVMTDSLWLRKYGTPGLPSSGSGGGGGPGDGPCRPSDPECEPIEMTGTPAGGGNVMGATVGTMALPADPYPDGDFTQHVYGIGYRYDRNGRRSELTYPRALTPGAQKTVTYGYHAWGPLKTVTGLMGDSSAYAYNASGQLQSLTYPGAQVERFAYDRDGRLARRQLASMYNDTLTYYPSGKIERVAMRAGMREAQHWYSGLGHLVAARWNSTIGGDYGVDEFRYDAHGNACWSRKLDALTSPHSAPIYDHSYAPGGSLTEIRFRTGPNYPTGTNSFRDYDRQSGDLLFGSEAPHQANRGTVGLDPVRYYYAADGKLRAVKKFGRRWDPYTGAQTHFDDLIQEVRYDALGRRVVQHTRREPECTTTACCPAIERYVWDGDQLLYELRASGAGSLETAWGSGRQYGRTGYVHGASLDAPLAVMRSDFESSPAIRITPLANWRGLFSGGWPECTGSNAPSCVHVEWPAPKLRTYLDGHPRSRGDWVGSLLQDQRDQSGLLYRRNRYYDPATGQFTQEDPIGLAGGLNLYGYAGGDPINFSDPFGLCGLPGAVASVAMGAALGAATGGYSLAAAAIDAGSGAACVGAISKLGKIGRAVGASRKLRAAMTAAGEVAQHGDEAHHIAAAGAKGARGARDILGHLGVDINDAANGVFLPKDFHRRMHTGRYYQEVTERLSAANNKEEALEILRTLGKELAERAR